MNRSSRLGALAAAALLVAANAGASGDVAYDRYTNRLGPDIALARYQAGELGVVLPSYARTYLYAAWRGVMLGAPGLKASPGMANGLTVSVEGHPGGYGDWRESAPNNVYDGWRLAVGAALKRDVLPARDNDNVARTYRACPDSSYAFAAQTLNALAQREDATPARLAAWVDTQRQVFRICGDDPEAKPLGWGQSRPAVAQPAPLPASEALYWRQMQEYQLASAAFYAEDYATANKVFARIGATGSHPLRRWGEYLALRAQARLATYVPPSVSQEERWRREREIAAEGPAAAAARQAAQQQVMAAIQASIDHILADASLKEMHEDARAIGRSMRARLTPKLRFAELSKALDNPNADPYVEDKLGDWRLLADRLMPVESLRNNVGFIDWIQSVQCDGGAQANTCARDRDHALAQWRRHVKEGNKPQARVWLMAATINNGTLPADVEKAALQVAESAPEYLTVRYGLARHYRLTRQADKARSLEDAVLTSGALQRAASPSARNLFRQERFAISVTPAEAAAYLMRDLAGRRDADTGEKANDQPPVEELAADGQRWLNSGLATADLFALNADQRLPAALRARIAIAAWMRFDLLGQEAPALAAAKQVEQGAPALAPVMRQYQKLATAQERRHWMLVSAMKWQLAPTLNGWTATRADFAQMPQDETTASMWCKLPARAGVEVDEDVATEQAPPAPETGNGAVRDKELAQLGALKTATGFVGDHIMRRAAAMPNDPELPWLLHTVVQSTRGGCLDADAKALSKRAFTLLHKRYGNSEWAGKTPYFY